MTRKLWRTERGLRRFVQWRDSSLERARKCGRVVIGGQVSVVAAGDDVTHLTGVLICGLVRACQVCSPKILNGRAGEISYAAGGWQA